MSELRCILLEAQLREALVGCFLAAHDA